LAVCRNTSTAESKKRVFLSLMVYPLLATLMSSHKRQGQVARFAQARPVRYAPARPTAMFQFGGCQPTKLVSPHAILGVGRAARQPLLCQNQVGRLLGGQMSSQH